MIPAKKPTLILLCHQKTEIWLKRSLRLNIHTVESKWMTALQLYRLKRFYSWRSNSSKRLRLTVTPTRPVMEIISGMFWWQFWSLVARIFSIVAAFDWRVLRVLMASWRKNNIIRLNGQSFASQVITLQHQRVFYQQRWHPTADKLSRTSKQEEFRSTIHYFLS